MVIRYRKYHNGHDGVISVDGFRIAEDNCAYACKKCGAIYQAKNVESSNLFSTSVEHRNLFPTKDPKCKNCGHSHSDLVRICKCEPIL